MSYLKECIYVKRHTSVENYDGTQKYERFLFVYISLLSSSLLLHTPYKKIFFFIYFIQLFYYFIVRHVRVFFSQHSGCAVCMDDVGLLTNSVFCAFQSANRIQRVQMIKHNLSLAEEWREIKFILWENWGCQKDNKIKQCKLKIILMEKWNHVAIKFYMQINLIFFSELLKLLCKE